MLPSVVRMPLIDRCRYRTKVDGCSVRPYKSHDGGVVLVSFSLRGFKNRASLLQLLNDKLDGLRTETRGLKLGNKPAPVVRKQTLGLMIHFNDLLSEYQARLARADSGLE